MKYGIKNLKIDTYLFIRLRNVENKIDNGRMKWMVKRDGMEDDGRIVRK